VLAGFIPLAPFFVPLPMAGSTTFSVSTLATACSFFLIGAAKGHVVHRSLLLSGLETLGIGSAAAALAYAVGLLFNAG
jgi:VIT1/CCC1 family predicted Fe2+/Mn2+ transporter